MGDLSSGGAKGKGGHMAAGADGLGVGVGAVAPRSASFLQITDS